MLWSISLPHRIHRTTCWNTERTEFKYTHSPSTIKTATICTFCYIRQLKECFNCNTPPCNVYKLYFLILLWPVTIIHLYYFSIKTAASHPFWFPFVFSAVSLLPFPAHSVLSFPVIRVSWWHLRATGWCGLYQDEKQRCSTPKMYPPLYISQQAQRSPSHWLFYVSPVVQVWWQASCDNYTLAAIESIGTDALISQIKQGFVFTLLKTHSLADN